MSKEMTAEEYKDHFDQGLIPFIRESVKTYGDLRAKEAVKEFAEECLPGGDDINDAADNYAFRVPYDGSNNFYDEVALKHFLAGVRFVEDYFKDFAKQKGVEI